MNSARSTLGRPAVANQRRLPRPTTERSRARTRRRRRLELEADAQSSPVNGEAADSAGGTRSATELGPAGPGGKDCGSACRSAIREEAGDTAPADEPGTRPEAHHSDTTPVPRTLESEVGLECRPFTGEAPVPATQPTGRGALESEPGLMHPPIHPPNAPQRYTAGRTGQCVVRPGGTPGGRRQPQPPRTNS